MTTHPEKLVEAVARALCSRKCKWPDDVVGPSATEPSGLKRVWMDYRDQAVAALDAIKARGMVCVPREPAPEMAEGDYMPFLRHRDYAAAMGCKDYAGGLRQASLVAEHLAHRLALYRMMVSACSSTDKEPTP